NRRFIKNAYLHHAVKSAFEGLLQEKQYPSYFLFLEVEAKSIDINIHPTKTEIKFDDEQSIYAILRSAIKHSLGQFNVVPSLDFDRESELDTPYDYNKKQPKAPRIEIDRNFNPFKNEGSPSSSKPKFTGNQKAEQWESLYTGLTTDDQKSDFSNLELES